MKEICEDYTGTQLYAMIAKILQIQKKKFDVAVEFGEEQNSWLVEHQADWSRTVEQDKVEAYNIHDFYTWLIKVQSMQKMRISRHSIVLFCLHDNHIEETTLQ